MAEWTPNDFSNIATVGAAAVCSIMMVLFKSRCSRISLCFGLYACDRDVAADGSDVEADGAEERPNNVQAP